MSVKKVLMISYAWPPMEGVGTMRAFKFAKFLPEYGWSPLVLTVKAGKPLAGDAESEYALNGTKVFRTDYKDVIGSLKRIVSRITTADDSELKTYLRPKKPAKRVSFVREMVTMPDDQIGWYSLALEEGKRIIEQERVDVIFSTSPPETAHLVARKLKTLSGMPWVADLRDLWAEDHFRPRSFIKKAALRIMEKSILKDADSVITVSEPWAERLKKSLRDNRGVVSVIENGFDEEDFGRIGFSKNAKFTISYTGKLHKDHQPLEPFFKAVADLVAHGKIDRRKIELYLCVFGYDKPDVEKLSQSFGLHDIVKESGMVSYERSLEIQRSSDALLFIQWRGEGGEGWYSAKLYDYIGSGRPILAMAAKSGIVADLIRRTKSGVIAENETELKDAILQLYEEYILRGTTECRSNPEEIIRLTRRNRAAQLACILESLCARRQ
ncbi:MAG: glycosyltransferase [Candidatus Omnitrophica bacterium]|nr:glycosyltransferase [Candidatus Omnitrophota bacterium]MCM8790647.1 glycosyltransferase [Candidatus Omnitrophota bacterium]